MRRLLVPVLVLSALTACSSDNGVEVITRDSVTESSATPSTDDGPDSTPDTAPGTEPVGTSDDPTANWPTPTIEWTDCPGRLECGTIEVPIDYDDPDSQMASIHLERLPASSKSDRIGSLLVNPGGPGFGGSFLAQQATGIYSEALLRSFDIIGFDPRGTGESTPAIDCVDDYDYWFAGGDITPDTPAEHEEIVQWQRDYTNECLTKNADIIEYIGTNNVARDMEMIRRALGEDKISYFGFSYGSELGATWATLFPNTVRAAVLDGAADPEADPIDGLLQQNKGFDDSLTAFFADCDDDPSCPIGPDSTDKFDTFMAGIDENPVPTTSGRPDLTRGMALTATAQAMYSDSYWPQLAQALADAIDGDGAGLLELWDEYFVRNADGTWGNELEAFTNILCADQVERPTIEEADAEVPRLNANSPRFSPYTTGDYTCTFWPPARDPRVAITGAGAGPIVVIGTTGDPATPLKGTRNMARTLDDGRLIVVDADTHTGYMSSFCASDAVDAYLIDLTPPSARGQELTCTN